MKINIIISVIFTKFLMLGCDKSNKNIVLENIKEDYSQEVLEKITGKNSVNIKNNLKFSVKFYPYFKAFGNSSVLILNEIAETDLNKFKDFEKLYKINYNDLKYNSLNYCFEYKNLKENYILPEISDTFSEDNNIYLKQSNNIEIYINESGKLINAFKKGEKKSYNYTSGYYYFKDKRKICSWIVIP